MRGWWPSPSGQSSDPRCAALTILGRGLLWSLCDAADGKGAIPLGSMSLDAVLLAVSGRTPEAEVRAAWEELQRVGLVMVDTGVIVLVLPSPTVRSACDDALREASWTPATHPSVIARPSDRRKASKRLAARWSRLGLRSRDARLSWLDSTEGRKVLAELGLDRVTAQDLADGAGKRRGTFGGDRDPRVGRGTQTGATNGASDPPANGVGVGASAGAATGASTEFPPAPPSREEETEEETERERELAHEAVPSRGADRNASGGDENGASNGNGPGRPRCPTVEPVHDSPTAADVLMCLRGEGRVRLSTTTTHVAELARAIATVTPVWTREGVRQLAVHVGAGHLRDGWKPSLVGLRGRDGAWTTLLSLHDEAQECLRCREARERAAPSPTPPDAKPPRQKLTREEAAQQWHDAEARINHEDKEEVHAAAPPV